MNTDKILKEVENYLQKKQNNEIRQKKHFPTILENLPNLFDMMEQDNFNFDLLKLMFTVNSQMKSGETSQEDGHKYIIDNVLNINKDEEKKE